MIQISSRVFVVLLFFLIVVISTKSKADNLLGDYISEKDAITKRTKRELTPQELYVARLETASIYFLAKFITWDSGKVGHDGRTDFCVLGKSVVNEFIMSSLKGEKIFGRTLGIWFIEKGRDLEVCDVIFIGKGYDKNLMKDVKYIEEVKKNVLIVAESTDISLGMVNIHPAKGRFIFLIDSTRAKKAGITIGPELLRLAEEQR